MSMVYRGNESDEELAQRFLDFDPKDEDWEPEESVAVLRERNRADSYDAPALIEAIRAARVSGMTWDHIGRVMRMSGEEAQRVYGEKVA